jgi:hypothetical protein
MKNGWIFVFTYDPSPLPTFIRFVTSKTKDEIKKNFGGNNNYCSSDDGRMLVSVWYCDEFSEEYKHLGHNLVNHGANCTVLDENDPLLDKIKKETIPTVDLDVVLKKPKVYDAEGYDDMVW